MAAAATKAALEAATAKEQHKRKAVRFLQFQAAPAKLKRDTLGRRVAVPLDKPVTLFKPVVLRPGETLRGMAEQLGVPVEALVALNRARGL